VFNRAFRARVQPVELARKLSKEMDSYKTVSVSRTYVPNEYIVFLSRDDRKQFEGYEPALLDELSAHLLEHAARENLALLTRPKVTFETDRRLRMGEFGIQARLVKPAATERDEAAQGDLGATMVYSAARPAESAEGRGEGAASQEKVETRALLQMNGKTFVIDRPRTVIGRSSRCDFVVDDPNVSRRHAELQRRGGDWYVVDLDSTNGVAVNGKPVRSAVLAPGDEIGLGTARLRFNVD
jgi:Protein of unknown function (DUF3662)/FHA domain